jgi:S1-C subfamily serine protease
MINVNKTLVVAVLLATSALGVAHGFFAGSTYSETISINDSHIHSDRNGRIIDIERKQGALVVTSLPSDGFFGLKVGDTIAKIDGKPVSSTSDFTAVLGKSGPTATFSIIRAGSPMDIVVQRHGGFDRFI